MCRSGLPARAYAADPERRASPTLRSKGLTDSARSGSTAVYDLGLTFLECQSITIRPGRRPFAIDMAIPRPELSSSGRITWLRALRGIGVDVGLALQRLAMFDCRLAPLLAGRRRRRLRERTGRHQAAAWR